MSEKIKVIQELEELQRCIDKAILMTPSGEIRNKLTEINMKLHDVLNDITVGKKDNPN